MEHIGSLMATMGIDITQAEKNIAKIEKDVKQYAKVVETEFKKIEKEFNQSEKIFKKYADTIDKEINSVKKDLASLEKQYGSLATTTGSSLDKVESKVKKHSTAINALLKTVRAAVLGYATVLATTKIVDFTTGIIKAGVELDSFERALVAITKSQKQARFEFDFVNKVAQDYGLNLQALRQSYVGLLASSQKTNLAGEETRRLFVATSAAASVLGMSTDDAQGSLKAFVQMISKGNVQAEELRGQLGDRLYGAFNKAADAMGVSTSELNKMLKKGDVLASDLIPKLTRLLEGEFLEAAKEAGNGPRASFEKLSTSILNLQEAIANSGVLDNFVNLAQETTKWVKANEKLLAQDFRTVFEVITFGGKTALVVIGGLVNKFSQLNVVLGKIGDVAGIAFNGNDNAIDETKSRIKELQQALLNLYSGYNFVSEETQKQRDIEIAQIKRQIKIYEEVLSKFENKEINLKVDASIGENFDEIDILFKELVDKSRLAQDDIQKNTDKTLEKEITATRKALDKIIADRKKAYETLLKQQEKYREDISEYLDTYNLSDYDKKLYYLEKEVQAFKEVGLQEIDYAEYIAAKKQEIDNDYYEQQQKELDKLTKDQKEAYDDLYETVYGYTRDVIDDFDNMGDTLVDLAKSIVKDIAAAFLAQNIVMPITIAVGSSLGLKGSNGVPYSAMAGGNGYGSIFGGMPSGNTLSWIGNNVPGMGFMSSAMGSIVPGSTMGGAIEAGTGLSSGVTWGTALGAGSISGLGYSMLGGALGLPQSEYSGLTAGLGGAAMSAYGGSLASMTGIGALGGPIGIGIGALLGGLAGGLFGGSEPEPRIGIRKGDISEYGYNPTTKDMSNQGPINDYIVDYYDAYFAAIDDLTSNAVKSVLADTDWERLRVHPEDFDSVEEALFSVNDKIFDTFAEGFISGLAGGQLDGYLDESFFNNMRSENESLLDTFVRLGTVINETDGFADQFTRQIDDFSASAESAYANVNAITGILYESQSAVDQIFSNASITQIDNMVTAWQNMIASLEAVNATAEQVTEATATMNSVIGANVTGISSTSLQSILASGYESGNTSDAITDYVNNALATALTAEASESIMSNYFADLNSLVGESFINGGVEDAINAVNDAMENLDWDGLSGDLSGLNSALSSLMGSADDTASSVSSAASSISAASKKISTSMNTLRSVQLSAANTVLGGDVGDYEFAQLKAKYTGYELKESQVRASLENIMTSTNTKALDATMDRLTKELGEEITLSDYTQDMITLSEYYSASAAEAAEVTKDYSSSVNRAASAVDDFTDELMSAYDKLRETRLDMFGIANPQSSVGYKTLYDSILSAALVGDIDAMAKLPGVADEYASYQSNLLGSSSEQKLFMTGIMQDLYDVEQIAKRKGGFADGGWSIGPESGYMALLHGTEKISTVDDVKIEQERLMMIVNVLGDINTKLSKTLKMSDRLTQGDDQLRVNIDELITLLQGAMNTDQTAIKTVAA